jgi:Zn finger protein HypA/HybF involved in hydrogenase expression
MHEKIFVDQIIKTAKKRGDVRAITVEVGDLAHLPAKDLEEALSQAVDWKIKIKTKKSKVKCGCGFVGEPKILCREHDLTLFCCPKCEKVPKILEGYDIILKEVKIK